MDAKELRIGNYVWVSYPQEIDLKTETKGHEICKIISINENGTVDLLGVEFPKTTWRNATFSKPIPLTEEWLVRFGFRFVERDYEGYNQFIKDSFESIYITEKNEFRYSSYKPCGYTDLKYVHQLQNLYFALTGEELTIK